MQNKKITICTCVSRSFIDKDKVVEIAAFLKKQGRDVQIEADLCKKAILTPNDMEEIASGILLACFPRAVRSLFHFVGLTVDDIIDIREAGCEEVCSNLQLSYTKNETITDKHLLQEEVKRFAIEDGTDAWYPVIDKDRCTECGKCHDFCLFGVYTINDKQVKVVQPQNCKNNCPACARMCPNKAIIFPKYEKSPINGGITEEESFNPQEMDKLYKERLRMRLQQRRNSIPLFKKEEE